METLRIRARSFRRWLESRPRTEVVGRGFRNEECPLAEYLTERFACPVDVSNDVVGIWFPPSEGGRTDLGLPLWAKRFVTAVDEAHPRGGQMTAGEALGALARAS